MPEKCNICLNVFNSREAAALSGSCAYGFKWVSDGKSFCSIQNKLFFRLSGLMSTYKVQNTRSKRICFLRKLLQDGAVSSLSLVKVIFVFFRLPFLEVIKGSWFFMFYYLVCKESFADIFKRFSLKNQFF